MPIMGKESASSDRFLIVPPQVHCIGPSPFLRVQPFPCLIKSNQYSSTVSFQSMRLRRHIFAILVVPIYVSIVEGSLVRKREGIIGKVTVVLIYPIIKIIHFVFYMAMTM